MTILAIDIGDIKPATTLIGADGQIHDRREPPTPASQTPQVLHDALSALVSPLQVHAQRIATASTGIIRDGSLLALNPHNLGGLLYFPLVKTLEQLTNLPTIATNDTQTAVWAEHQALDGDMTGMVFIIVSTGVGGGVVSGGKLRTGPGGLAGHVGHTLADPHGPACGHGHTGYAGTIVSGHGITTVVQEELAGVNVETTSTYAGQGDEQAQQLIHRSARTLTKLIVDIKITTDRQCVMAGGSVGLTEGYLALVETYLTQEPAAFHVDLLAAYYRHDTGLPGVALLAWGETL